MSVYGGWVAIAAPHPHTQAQCPKCRLSWVYNSWTLVPKGIEFHILSYFTILSILYFCQHVYQPYLVLLILLLEKFIPERDALLQKTQICIWKNLQQRHGHCWSVIPVKTQYRNNNASVMQWLIEGKKWEVKTGHWTSKVPAQLIITYLLHILGVVIFFEKTQKNFTKYRAIFPKSWKKMTWATVLITWRYKQTRRDFLPSLPQVVPSAWTSQWRSLKTRQTAKTTAERGAERWLWSCPPATRGRCPPDCPWPPCPRCPGCTAASTQSPCFPDCRTSWSKASRWRWWRLGWVQETDPGPVQLLRPQPGQCTETELLHRLETRNNFE